MNSHFTATHDRHIAQLRESAPTVDAQGLRIGERYVMFFAERDLMCRHAARLLDGTARADVLDVGVGLGIFAEAVTEHRIGSYTGIEPHPGVADLTRRRLFDHQSPPVTVLTQPWQLVALRPATFDAVMLDTWPPDGHADTDFAEFVARVAWPCLRPGGRFSFFHSGEILSPMRAAVLDQYFPGWSALPYTMPAELTPPDWTKPTRDFLIPLAVKGG